MKTQQSEYEARVAAGSAKPKIDVLAALDNEIRSMQVRSANIHAIHQMREVRKVTAELIASARLAVSLDRVTDGLRVALDLVGGAA